MGERALDLITIGRVSVDLYGGQVGRLEDMASFAKYVGGCLANIAVGAARLGKPALLSRVGDENMGRFIREQLVREGVDTSRLVTDQAKLADALVILGIRDRETFPLIFYRENCADMALTTTISIPPSSVRRGPSWSPAFLDALGQKQAWRRSRQPRRRRQESFSTSTTDRCCGGSAAMGPARCASSTMPW